MGANVFSHLQTQRDVARMFAQALTVGTAAWGSGSVSWCGVRELRLSAIQT